MSVLFGKDIRELLRTQRILVLPFLFLFFGLGGPILVRLLPLIMESAQSELGTALPDMGPADGLLQFLEMSRQLGILAVVLMYMGAIAGERSRGTLAFLLVKPVSLAAFLFSRWTVNAIYLLLSFLLGSGVALGTSALALGAPDTLLFLAAAGLYLSYLLLALSWTFFFSALTTSSPLAGGMALVPLFVFPVVGFLWQPLETYGPYGAVQAGTAAIGAMGVPGTAIPSSSLVSAGVGVALSLVLLVATWTALRRAEL